MRFRPGRLIDRARFEKEPLPFLGREAVIGTEHVTRKRPAEAEKARQCGRHVARCGQQAVVDRLGIGVKGKTCPSPRRANGSAWAPRSKQTVYSPEAITIESVNMKVSGQSDGKKASWQRAAAIRS